MAKRNKHRAPAPPRQLKATRTVAALGAGLVVPLVGSAGSARAASVSAWEKVAECETGNVWNDPAVAGDGGAATGGLQFHQDSWELAGGLKYARRPYLATKEQQILVAERLLQIQGPSAWSCNVMVGHPLQSSGPQSSMYKGGVRPYPHHSPPPTSAVTRPKHPEPSKGDTYTVVADDTLSGIAKTLTGEAANWRMLYRINEQALSGQGPDLIYPGQILRVR